MTSSLPTFSTSFGFTPLAPVMPHFWENMERLREVVTTEQNKRTKTRRIVRPKKKRAQVLAQTLVKRAKKHRQKKHKQGCITVCPKDPWPRIFDRLYATSAPRRQARLTRRKRKSKKWKSHLIVGRQHILSIRLWQKITMCHAFVTHLATCSSITASGWIKKDTNLVCHLFHLWTSAQHWLQRNTDCAFLYVIPYALTPSKVTHPLNRIHTFLGC